MSCRSVASCTRTRWYAIMSDNIKRTKMRKRIFFTVLLLLAWMSFCTLLYKTIVVMLIALVWQGKVREKIPERIRPYGVKAMWACLVLVLWVAMPRYRITCGDRVRMVYLDDEGQEKHAPLSHYIVNTLIPEEEVVNLGIKSISFLRPVLSVCGMHIGGSLINQATEDIDNGKIDNFFKPYDNLGMENPMSGVYPQFFNQMQGSNDRSVYICEPKGDENVPWSKGNGFKYPLVVFCHGYLGNWQLYQGIWKDLDNCIVLSIGTQNLSGIFTQGDVKDIFDLYIPALERMGYNIDNEQLHLMGLSNGGSAIVAAMHSSYTRKFKSLTSISCNLEGLKRVNCQVNFIGGGKDGSSNRMPSQCRQLKAMGVDVDIYFKEDENHFILVNKREEIINFLKERLQLSCARMSE